MKYPWLSLLGAWLFVAGAVAQTQFNVLVLAIPDKYHYEYIPIARKSFEQLARQHQFQLTWTSDPETFEGDLAKFSAIVMLNTTGEVFNAAQRQKFQAYVQHGGGVMLVHAATATKRQWDWYEKLIGRSFRKHPYIQSAVVQVADENFPAGYALPKRWTWSDEWYEFDEPLVPDLHVVLRVDETTYDPARIWPGQHSEGMGADHPVAWYHLFEGGRVFVTALGHIGDHYTDQHYLEHLYGGLWWTATGKGLLPAK